MAALQPHYRGYVFREGLMSGMHQIEDLHSAVRIPADGVLLRGDLVVPSDARGLVLSALDTGGGSHGRRDRYVACAIERGGFATLLIDLLTSAEEQLDRRTLEYRFDVDRLAQRLAAIVDWLGADGRTADLPVGVLGAGVGGAAALMAAALRPGAIAAVVSGAGRLELVDTAVRFVHAPTLLIAGELDAEGIGRNQRAMAVMPGLVHMEVAPGARHLLEQADALDQTSALAAEWFAVHLTRREASAGARPRASHAER
jgi:putative phosphoribosyl transferase